MEPQSPVARSTKKHMRRRLIVGTLAGVLVLGAMLLLLVSPALAPPVSFPDVPASHPYYTGIMDLAGRSIIQGYTNGNFGPGDPVLRQQFAKMIVLSGAYPVSVADVCPFSDVEKSTPPDLYPDHYVAVAAAHSITVGTTPSTFSPGAHISRYQVISMVVRTADDLKPGLLAQPPASYAGTPGWADAPTHGQNARRAEYNGLLAGLPLASLDPWGDMPRGEVAQVLHNLLLKLTSPTTTTTASTTTTTTGSTTSTTTTTSSTTTTTTLPSNHAPLAQAGPDQSVASGALVTLNGSASFDPDGDPLTYAWRQTAGPSVTLSAPTTVSPSFATPVGPVSLSFTLAVSDGKLTSEDSVSVTVAAPPPHFESLGGGLTSSPAAISWGPEHLDVYVRGWDGALWHTYRHHQPVFSAWESLGGSIVGRPAPVTAGEGDVEVFARGASNHLLRWVWNQPWIGPIDLGGGLTSEPSLSYSGPAPHLSLAGCIGTDGHLWELDLEGFPIDGTPRVSDWRSLGGAPASSPGWAFWMWPTPLVAGTDGALWVAGSTWSSLGGSAEGKPAVSAQAVGGTGYIDVFARSASNHLMHWRNVQTIGVPDAHWLPVEDLGADVRDEPSVVSFGGGHIDVYVRGPGDSLWHTYLNNDVWSGWFNLGGGFQGAPSAVSSQPGRIDVFGWGVQGDLVHWWYDGRW